LALRHRFAVDGEQGKAADGMSQREGENPSQHLTKA
jgi:hypothetical protein